MTLGRWTFRIDDIARAAMTDNVIDLMTRKIQRLSRKTQRALTLASCIGNVFDRQTLAMISEQPAEAAGDELQEAIQEGLIIPIADCGWGISDSGLRIADLSHSNSQSEDRISDNPKSEIRNPKFCSYSFLHDRVQQAAYALIPMEEKQIVHLTVGRLLLESPTPNRSEEKLFDIVQHFNLGSSLIAEGTERIALARLNLSAGRRAKSSTAYEAALDYFKAGVGFLNEKQWASDYDLAFSLHLEPAECHNLCGNFDDAERDSNCC